MRPVARPSLGVPTAAAVLLVAAALGSVSLVLPFGRDQGTFAFVADRCLRGDVLYRDVYFDKPPMTVATYALAQVAFGRTMTAIRILDLLWASACAVLVASIGARLVPRGGRALPLLSAVLFAYSWAGLDYWNAAQAEGWLLLPTLLSVWLVLRVRPGGDGGRSGLMRGAAGAGAAAAFAFLFKYTAGLGIVVPAVLAFGAARTPRERRGACVALAAGFAVPVLAALLALGVAGAFDGFLDSQARWLSRYAGVREDTGFASAIRQFTGYFRAAYPLPALLGVTGAAWTVARLLAPGRRREVLRVPALLGLWTAASALGVILQGKYFVYHFLPMVPPLALLGAWCAVDALGALRDRVRAPALPRALAAALLIGLLLAPSYRARIRDLLDVAGGAVPRQEYWARPAFATLDFSLRDDLRLVRFLEQRTRSGDRVDIWGFEPLVNWLADRPPVGRFAYNVPLAGAAHLPALRREYVTTLRSDPPEWFVVQRGDAIPFTVGHAEDSQGRLREFPELARFVQERYEPCGAVGSLDQLRRPDEPRFLVLRRR
jgi:hypothetical protein